MKSDTINLEDTICAISTPPGIGGIAVIRISGPQAIAITDRIWQGKRLSDTPGHTVRFGRIIDPMRDNEMLDEGVATVFRAPSSFTGDDVVELSVHGSKYVQRRLLEILTANGARLAEAGEFTRPGVRQREDGPGAGRGGGGCHRVKFESRPQACGISDEGVFLAQA